MPNNPFSARIASKLVLWFSTTILISVFIVSYFAYKEGEAQLSRQILERLTVTTDNTSTYLDAYMDVKINDLELLSSRPIVIDAIKDLTKAFKENGFGSPEYAVAAKNMGLVAAFYRDKLGFQDVFLVSPTGTVIYSLVKGGRYFGADLKTGVYRRGEFGKAFDLASTLLDTEISDFEYDNKTSLPTAFIAAPIISDGKILGIAVLQIDTVELHSLVRKNIGLSETGEVVLASRVGNDAVFVMPTRLDPNESFKRRYDLKTHSKMPLVKALQGMAGHGISIDYRGKKVLAAWQYLPLFNWGLVTKIDAQEAFAPVVKLKIHILLLTIVVALSGGGMAYFIGRSISMPIRKLQKGAEIIGGGNLDYKIVVDRKDELGLLSRAFNLMAEDLRKTTTSIDNLNKEISERKNAENNLKRQSQELDASLKEMLKSREILTSMLDDNNKIRERLEESIADLKSSQNMLIQSEKLASLGRLISDISHEVNNPLMIISSHAQLALMPGSVSGELKDTLELIVKECQRAADIMHRTLKFAQPSKGVTKETDICKSIDAVVSIIEKPFEMAKVEIKRDYPEKPVIISVDNQLMQEVFMNILNNAKEAMPDGGTITIAASLEGDFFRIDFKDTGCGIAEEDKKKILEPFFTTKEKGTGLGLSICYGIIKAHNGELKFESQLNKGSTATVLLPLGGG